MTSEEGIFRIDDRSIRKVPGPGTGSQHKTIEFEVWHIPSSEILISILLVNVLKSMQILAYF